MKRVGDILLTAEQHEQLRGKFRRTCEPRRGSGILVVPKDIHEQYCGRGASREKLWHAFVKTNGDKDWVSTDMSNLSSWPPEPMLSLVVLRALLDPGFYRASSWFHIWFSHVSLLCKQLLFNF